MAIAVVAQTTIVSLAEQMCFVWLVQASPRLQSMNSFSSVYLSNKVQLWDYCLLTSLLALLTGTPKCLVWHGFKNVVCVIFLKSYCRAELREGFFPLETGNIIHHYNKEHHIPEPQMFLLRTNRRSHQMFYTNLSGAHVGCTVFPVQLSIPLSFFLAGMLRHQST